MSLNPALSSSLSRFHPAEDPTHWFLIADLCGVCFCCRLSESHASSDRPQVCQPSGGHQILRSRHVSQTRVLKAQTSFFRLLSVCVGLFTPLSVVNVTQAWKFLTVRTGLLCASPQYRISNSQLQPNTHSELRLVLT